MANPVKPQRIKTIADKKAEQTATAAISAEIKELEEELKKTKYNKATQYHIGLVKAKIARLKEKLFQKVSSGKKGLGYGMKKAGDATVAIVGFPSAGKSTLLNQLTNADSKIGSYDFTTLTVVPGVMKYGFAQLQLLDIPGLIEGASMGAGRGKEVIAVVRSADLVIFIVDVFNLRQLEILKKELYDAGLRIDQSKPDIRIKKVERGGISVSSPTKLTKIDNPTIQVVLREYKLNNCDIKINDDIDVDQLIDAIEGNKVYVPSLIVLNKIDMVDDSYIEHVRQKIGNCVLISAEKGINLDALRKAIYDKFRFIRVYMKEVGKKPDLEEPMIMKYGSTVQNVCEKIHQDFVRKFKFCRVWGRSAKFPGQRFTLSHVLQDEDILELHLR